MRCVEWLVAACSQKLTLDSEEANRTDGLREDRSHKGGAISREASKARLDAEKLDVGNPDQSCRWSKVLFRKVTSEFLADKFLTLSSHFPFFVVKSRFCGHFWRAL